MNEEIRPSSLPKLQKCRCFASCPNPGPAAERGTRIDAAIRSIWQQLPILLEPWLGNNPDIVRSLAQIAMPGTPEADLEAVCWAVAELIRHCEQHGTDWRDLLTVEERLKAAVPLAGIATGTMDAADFDQGFLFDFKTGEIRDYKAQMAAYALACMEYARCDSWRAVLLFVDKQHIVRHSFTRAEAEDIVRSIRDAEQKPTTCEYCTWCRFFDECPAVENATRSVTALLEHEPTLMESLLDDHQRASEYLANFKLAEEFVKRLKAKLTERLAEIPSNYFKVVAVSGKKQVSPAELAEKIGAEEVVKLCALISLKDAEAAWKANCPDKPFPSEMVKTAGGYTSLRTTKPKE